MTSRIEILGLGAVAMDDLLYVEAYPEANSKVHVLDRERQCGGLTATALVAASRLGCLCAYGGVTGTDDASDFALAVLAGEGVCTDLACRRADRRIYHSTIIVDRFGRRTLFSDGRDVESVNSSWPDEHIIRSCEVLFVDHTAIPGMIRAARVARSAGIPVVGDLERAESKILPDLMNLIDHLIVPREFARTVTGRTEPGQAAECLWADQRKAVVVTCGENGSWFVEPGLSPTHQPAFRVQVIDTTGCGDVFHGAYAAGLVMGMDLPGRVRLAGAAAALKAARRGGQSGCPTFAEVERLLREQSPA